jgi:ferrous iron transport protein A
MKSISDVKVGERVIIKQLSGGKDFNNRIVAMGFVPGAEVTVFQNYGHGPVIVTLRDTRVALGRGEAMKVMVEIVNGEQSD